MKRLSIILVVSLIFISCSEDEPNVAPIGQTPTIDNITFDIDAITSASVVVDFTSNSFSSSGGQLIREIWYKKPIDTEWSIKNITNAPSEQLQHLVDGLEFATKYSIKAVFTIGELVRESGETNITTLPFETTALKDGFEQILLISKDSSVDFQALESEPSFYLKFANDSIPMTINAISKDSLLIDFQADNSIFFEGNDEYVEKINTSVSFGLKDYYEKDWKTLEVFNRQPKIDAIASLNVVSCTGLDHTKLQFTGFFWNAREYSESLFEADDYSFSIKNVQDPSISSPVFTKSDFIENVEDACETGFDIFFELPVQNRFHSGSSLWVSFPQDLLPEGNYRLQFSVIKNGETYTAEPFEFELTYE